MLQFVILISGSNLRELNLIVTLIALPRYICNWKEKIGHHGTTQEMCFVRALRGNY
jgi:hypothetical protein